MLNNDIDRMLNRKPLKKRPSVLKLLANLKDMNERLHELRARKFWKKLTICWEKKFISPRPINESMY